MYSNENLLIRDKHTGVKYLFVQNGYGGGLSLLFDKDCAVDNDEKK